MSNSKKETALQAQNTGFLALANSDLSGMMAEELDGLDAGFERIKIPSGGTTIYEIPNEDGDMDAVKEFSAVILWHHPLRVYYMEKYTGGSNPPDCGSIDGVCGDGDPGGECRRCPLNQFDTGENGAKACKDRRRVYVLREGEVFPLLLSLPTGSLKEFTRYLKRLLSKGRKSNSVVTRFTLQKAVNKGGVTYSQAQFAIDRPLTPEEYALIDKLSGQVKTFSRRVAIDFDREGEDDGENIEVDEETGEIIEPLTGGGSDV